MASKKFYLRIEAVNLDNFVYDTNNLSVIRGGGLMLLELPEHAENKLKESHSDQIKKITPISKGASWGLFSIELKDETPDCVPNEVAETLKKALKETQEIWLRQKKIKICTKDSEGATREIRRSPEDMQKVVYAPKHATIMVEVHKPGDEDEKFQDIREKLLAKIRWRQMESPSIAFPTKVEEPVKIEKEDGKISRYVCELDLVRPAAERSKYKIQGEKRAVSSSSYARYKYGVWGKSDQWYEDVTGLKDLPLFTHHFHEIADDIAQEQKELSLLEGKMAVIYLDGNHFGKLQREKCKSAKKQAEFDKRLREKYQNKALKHLLEIIKNDEAWINPHCWFPGADEMGDATTHKIRLETLLWGGDELIWVAPAWRGWWLLGKYFQLVEGGLDKEHWNFDGSRLTFGAGIVFCHNTAPIYRIKKIAWQLAEEAKSVSRKENFAAIQVLESYDLAGTDFERFRRERRPLGLTPKEMVIRGGNMLDIASYFNEVKKELPKRQVYRIVQGLLEGEEPDDGFSSITKGLSENAKNCLKNLEACFSSKKAMWFHLLELWDYLIEPSSSQEGGQTP